jgi:hypothetical protein
MCPASAALPDFVIRFSWRRGVILHYHAEKDRLTTPENKNFQHFLKD